jgi:hypothetical protein
VSSIAVSSAAVGAVEAAAAAVLVFADLFVPELTESEEEESLATSPI